MCLKVSTVSVSWDFSEFSPVELAALLELSVLEVEPVIRTSCPTCLLRVELAPCSWNVNPESEVRV